MQRTFYICTIFALICVSAITWIAAQPQLAAAMSSTQESGTATIPAIGADITVGVIGYEEFADGSIGYGELSEWILTTANPDTATYELTVPTTSLRLSYGLPLDGSGDEYDAYRRTGEAIELSPSENQIINQDFVLIAYDATVRGTVLAPDGSAVSEGSIWVEHNPTGPAQRVAIVDGVFETQIVAGLPYGFYINDGNGDFSGKGMTQTFPYVHTATSGGVEEIELQLEALESTITGIVYESVPANGDSDSEEYDLIPHPGAYVTLLFPYGSAGAEYVGYFEYPMVQTDENGRYTILVASGTSWEIMANGGGPDGLALMTWPMLDPILNTTEAGQTYQVDLTLNNVGMPEMDDTSNDTESDGQSDAAEASTGPLSEGNNGAESSQANVLVLLPLLVTQ